MPTALDLGLVALIAVVWPLYEYFVDWPAFLRGLRENPGRARAHEYGRAIAGQWLLVAAGVALWLRAGRPWSALGLELPVGDRLWGAVGVVLLIAALYGWQARGVAKSPRTIAYLRERLAAQNIEPLLPHTARELGGFILLSLTAGFCEEFLWRGYFIWALAPQLGWWGAAALGIPLFGLLHAYQGRNGMLRTAAVGAVLTLAVSVTHSLVPAMAVHALVDIGSGVVTFVALNGQLGLRA